MTIYPIVPMTGKTYTESILYADGLHPRYDGTASAHVSTLGGRYDYAFDAHDRLTAADYTAGEEPFVGHSQGAMEASASIMATGNCAMAYNPATLTPATRLTNGLFSSGKIENYISATPKVLGQQKIVDYLNRIQNPYGNALPGKTTLVEVSWFWTHSIDKIVEALKNKQKPNK